MMPFIQRKDGLIIGCFGAPQEGIPEEFLESGDPELAAYLNPPETPVDKIRRYEREMPISQRHLRELTLAIAVQAGQVNPQTLNHTVPLNTESQEWLALSIGIQRCVLQERAIRAERAKL